jgi:ATP-binding cassette, subfamily B, bacterial
MNAPASTDPKAVDPKAVPNLPTWPVVKRILTLAAPYKWKMAIAICLMIASIPGELLPGLVAIYLVDHVIGGQTSMAWLDPFFSMGGLFQSKMGLLMSACMVMVVLYTMTVVLDSLGSNLLERTAQRFIFDTRQIVYDKLQGQSLNYLHKQKVGDLMSRAMGDVGEMQSFLTSSIHTVIMEVIIWCAVVGMAMWIDWRVTSATLFPIIIVFILLRMFNKKVRPIYKRSRETLGRVSSRIQENLSGIQVIKIFGREAAESARFNAVAKENYNDQVASINARTTYFPLSRIVGFTSNVGMFGMGGWLILGGHGFTIGGLIAIRSYWWRMFGPVYSLARVNDMVQRGVAAGRRVFDVLDEPVDVADKPGAPKVERVRGAIELQSVTFAYENAEKQLRTVLRDVNMKVSPGQRVALCGPSGAGKSTLLALIVRFYDVTGGRVLIDGRDVRDVEGRSLRSRFALVQQETFLFNESVMNNIRYGRPEATEAEVFAAAQAADAHEFITQLPKGYETEVGERGVRLSGGQKQRISIARAFLANPDVLLLDEPTSSVEPDSEAAILRALDRLMSSRTSIITSHRPAMIAKADVVYVVGDSTVVDSGPPSEVRQRNEWLDRFLRSGDVTDTLEESAARGDGI